jgi:WD40 repeat protein/class 3 adenylate cyclase
MERVETADGRGAEVSVHTFLIADIRGYSTFTRERGDEAAARLATRFADLARDSVEARSGRVLELRGDEALAVFQSNEQAVRAAIELQEACREATEDDPELPLPVGVGIEAGEAIAVEEGYRGRALNLAARLCAKAAAGQVLVTRAVAEAMDGALVRFETRGPAELKGFDAPVELLEAIVPVAVPAMESLPPTEPLPPELDDDIPLVGREHELRWLRGTWRQTRRARGRVLFVSGPAGIGKTRLAAEIARWVHDAGHSVTYAGTGGTAAAQALGALDRVSSAARPTLLIIDQLDILDEVVEALAARIDDLGARPVLVVGLVRGADGHPALEDLVARANLRGEGHRPLAGLDLVGVREIVAIYAGDAAADAPLERMLRSTVGIPARLHEEAADWARDEGARRLAAAAEWLAQGRAKQAAGLDLTATAIGVRLGRIHGRDDRPDRIEVCPYRGLAPFQEKDAAYFFGRERLVGELAARTVGSGLLAVAGPSGSGKSSVVMGGLLPSLAAGLLPGSERWRHVTVRPGEHPVGGLEAAVDSDGGERLVLAVDQFEEVFTLTGDEDERREFLDRLIELAQDPDRRMVVVTVRGDYLGHVAPYGELADLLAPNLVLVGPMSPDELRRAIELPARRSGLRVESALVQALVDEVEDEPGALPLLSTALVELWRAREGGWLRMEAYERTGGVRGAVARLAEESFGRLDDPEREAARAVLLRLASGEGESLSRRRVPMQELEPDTDPVRGAVLARFVEDRLLTAGEGTVEVAHEALLREWPRLRAWLEEDAEGRAVRQHLTDASTQWTRGERDPSELLRGARLSAAMDWATLHGRELNRTEQEFLAESRSAAEGEVQRQQRTNRRLRGLLAGVAVFLALALVAGGLALVQRSHARNAATRAERAATTSLANTLGSEGINEPRLDRGLLLAREAVNINLSDETKSDLLWTVLRNPQQIGAIYFGDTGRRPQHLGLSPDGKILAVSFNEDDIGFYDATTLKRLAQVPAFGGPIAPLTFANHAPLFATYANVAGDVRLFDTRTFKPVRVIRFHQEYANLNYGVHTTGLFFSRNDRVLWWGFEVWPPNTLNNTLTTTPLSVIESYSVATGRLLSRTAVDRDWQMGVAPMADGSRLVVVDRSAVFVHDADARHVLRRIALHGLPPGDIRLPIAASADGKAVAIGRDDGSVGFVSLTSGRTSIATGGHTADVVDIRFTPDGNELITVGNDNRVVVWNVASQSVAQTFLGHGGAVHGVATDGRTLYTSSLDGTVFVWDLAQTRSLGRRFAASSGDSLFDPAFPQRGVAYFALSPDGRTLAAPEADGKVILWDLSASPPRHLRAIDAVRPGGTPWVQFSPDGKTLLATDLEGHVVLIDLATGAHRFLPGLKDAVMAASFSPDGRQVAASSWHCSPFIGNDRCYQQLALWRVPSDRLVHPLMKLPGIGGDYGKDVAFSPSGASLAVATGANGTSSGTWLVDTRTWKVTRRIRPDADTYAAFSPDGRVLATTGQSGLMRLWDTRSWKGLGQPLGVSAGFGLSLSFNPNGRLLATAGTDGTVRIFDLRDPTHPVPFGPPTLPTTTGLTSARFTPDGSSLVVLDENGNAWVWPMRWQTWAAHACEVARRQLSRSEWSEFLGDRPYRAVCPGPRTP